MKGDSRNGRAQKKRRLRSLSVAPQPSPHLFFACLSDTNAFPLYSPQLDIVSLAPSISQRFPDGARKSGGILIQVRKFTAS